MKDETRPDLFVDMSVKLARHNLEVTLRRTKEQCFQAAKKMALDSAELAWKVDGFVRRQYSDEPKKMAEWNQIMQRYESGDDEVED